MRFTQLLIDLDLPAALSITREAARNAKIEPAERRRLILDFNRVLGLRLAHCRGRKAACYQRRSDVH